MLRILFIVPILLLLSACGTDYQADSGFAVAVVDPGSSKVDQFKDGPYGGKIDFPVGCWVEPCAYAAVIDHTTYTTSIKQDYWISASEVTVSLDIAVTYRTAMDRDARLSAMKLGADPQRSQSKVKVYGGQNVFMVYVAKRAPDAIRQLLNSKHQGKPMTIEIIMANFETIGPMLTTAVTKFAEGTPIEIVDTRISGISWPESIKEAKLAVRKVDDDRKRQLKEAAAAIEIAKKTKEVELAHAGIALEVDGVITEHLDEKLATWIYLEALTECAKNSAGCSMTAIPPAMIAGSVNLPVTGTRR